MTPRRLGLRLAAVLLQLMAFVLFLLFAAFALFGTHVLMDAFFSAALAAYLFSAGCACAVWLCLDVAREMNRRAGP